jgi:hypothetical protein
MINIPWGNLIQFLSLFPYCCSLVAHTAMPDFAQVYNFLGSVFDPDKSGHLQRLKAMDPIDVETVCLLEFLLSLKYKTALLFHSYMPSYSNHTIFCMPLCLLTTVSSLLWLLCIEQLLTQRRLSSHAI